VSLSPIILYDIWAEVNDPKLSSTLINKSKVVSTGSLSATEQDILKLVVSPSVITEATKLGD